MATENYLESLKRKHAAVAAKIQLLEMTAVSDSDDVKALKKEKLSYKDKIARLENPDRLTAPKSKSKKVKKGKLGKSGVSAGTVEVASPEETQAGLKKVA